MFGLNAEQELTRDIGIFGRLGWNDGKTESFAFTAIDRLATVGIFVTGERWHHHHDTAATEINVSGISGIPAVYLARGGYDFIIGDRRLNYGPETISESYTLQHVSNPAYNRDRGPVWIPSLRLHMELGKR